MAVYPVNECAQHSKLSPPRPRNSSLVFNIDQMREKMFWPYYLFHLKLLQVLNCMYLLIAILVFVIQVWLPWSNLSATSDTRSCCKGDNNGTFHRLKSESNKNMVIVCVYVHVQTHFLVAVRYKHLMHYHYCYYCCMFFVGTFNSWFFVCF